MRCSIDANSGTWSEEQKFKAVLQLVKDAFFKHGEKDALRSCVKAVKFCATESRGELQDVARNQVKELEDGLIAKLKSAMKDVVNGDDEYSLLVNLKRLYELQLLWQVPIESLYEGFVRILQRFRNIDEEVITFLLLNMFLHVAWCLHSIIASETVSENSISSLLLKRSALFEQLDYFLHTPPNVNGGCGNQLACRVCSILAELWCLFKKTKFASTKMEILGYCPDESNVQKYWELCEQLLNVSDEIEDEDGNKEYIEDTNRDAVILAATKLVANDSVPMEHLGPEIISRFGMYGTSVTEIIKHLITALKKKYDDVSNIFLQALKRSHQRYLIIVSASNDKSMSSKSFQECKDLASRLSGLYVGAARNKHKSEILNIIREGINYAFLDAPKQLSFLDGVVLHFVSKLPTPDILDIMRGVEKRTENVKTDQDPSGWRPYHVFLESLHEKYAKNEGLQDEKEGATVRRRGRPRKKQNIQGKRLFDEQPSSEEEDSISGSDRDAEDEDEKQVQEEDAPLIHSIRPSSKLRSLKVPREDNGNQQKTGGSG
ncbi:Sister-chromatid cohesion protein 3 [Abeliophyllum distichum]|uniref:Sister-chromatid cohesion protein 3 n=1 Tax=Abeliophyllum distichum TaxID=126358 RepID=A0ABD1VT64_9LAMI